MIYHFSCPVSHQRIIHSLFQDGLANPCDAETLKTHIIASDESSSGYPGSTYLLTQKFEFNWTVMGNMDKVKHWDYHLIRTILSSVASNPDDCFGFAPLFHVNGLENSCHLLSQSDAELQSRATWLLAFSRPWGRLRVFALSSYRLLVVFPFVLILAV